MADTKKFSEFTDIGTPTESTNIVGFVNDDNVRFTVGDIDLADLDGTVNLDTQTTGILPITKGGTGADNQSSALNLISGANNKEDYRILRVLLAGAYWVRQETNYRLNGTFRNVFGGSPQIIGDVLEFGTAKSSATDHGSVFIPSRSAKLTELAFKWVSGTAMSLSAGQSWTIRVYKLNNTSDDVTVAGNWQLHANTNVSINSSSNGFPFFVSPENIFFPINQVYMFVLVETGTAIGSTTAEIDVYLQFRQELDRY